MEGLREFVVESNRIEGIRRAPTKREIEAHETLLKAKAIMIPHMEDFVDAVAPGNRLRDVLGFDVRVGNHVPPRGCPELAGWLNDILGDARDQTSHPYATHHAYETLHPFTDGNGRSGRALWLWMMLRDGRDPYVLRRGFLHTWYYQSLSAGR